MRRDSQTGGETERDRGETERDRGETAREIGELELEKFILQGL